jgi:hypothetical protein
MPPRRLVLVKTLRTMQLVDGALPQGQQCRDMLKAAGYDFKLDDYLVMREQMQERMCMRLVQRLHQRGIVATYRDVQLWQPAAPEGAAPQVRARPS